MGKKRQRKADEKEGSSSSSTTSSAKRAKKLQKKQARLAEVQEEVLDDLTFEAEPTNKKKKKLSLEEQAEAREERETLEQEKAFLRAKAKANQALKKAKLPIKVADGSIVKPSLEDATKPNTSLVFESNTSASSTKRDKKNSLPSSAQESESEDEVSTDGAMQATETPTEPANEVQEKVVLNAAARLLMREEKKVEIAKLAEAILSDPHNGVQESKELEGRCLCKELLEIARSYPDSSIRKLAMLSLMAVFKDILPGYRIVIIENEKNQLSKQVRLLRKFEKNLLERYQEYLTILHSVVKKHLGSGDSGKDHRKPPPREPKGLSEVVVAIRGMCTMMVARPTFNFRENLLANIIPRMNSLHEEVRSQCCACISTLLQEDVSGDLTLEAVVYIARFVKAHKNGADGAVHPDVCKVLLKCDLKGDMKDVKTLDKAKKQKKQKKKQRKKGDEVAMGLDEAEANADQISRHAKNVEALRELFTMYLRVLKRGPQSILMPVVLRGVARFVHLINLDIAQALISVLTSLVKADMLSEEAGLQAVHTVALTLRGPGSELQVDEGEFVAHLYRVILRLCKESNRDELVPLLVQTVESLFLGRKLFRHNRVAAVVSRLSVFANFCSPHAILAVVAVIRELMTRYPTVCRPLLDGETEEGEGGNSLALGIIPTADENEFSLLDHQTASALWPLAQLRFHYHPFVREFVQDALKMKYLLPSERPLTLFEAYNPYREGGFNPPIPSSITVSIPQKQNKFDGKQQNQSKNKNSKGKKKNKNKKGRN